MTAHSLNKPRVSASGRWGFVLTALMIFSFRADYRLHIAGLLVHPFLVLLPFAYLFTGFDIRDIPKRVTIPLLLFFTVFSFACIQNVDPWSEIFKVGATVLIFLFFARAVNSEEDFELIGWGLLLCAVAIGVQGFFLGEETESLGERLSGINVLEGIGNKNAQSLFTLPGVFVGSYFLINAISQKKVFKICILAVLLFFIVVSIFLSANRSGWLGLFIIMISIFFVRGVSVRTLFYAGILILITYLAVDNYAEKIFERKRRQTVEGYKSDEGRKMLMVESLEVGIEHPLLGVGLDELHHQMAIRLGVTRFRIYQMDTHFLPGYLLGSSGVVAFLLFFVFLSALFAKPDKRLLVNPRIKSARLMILFFVSLFVIRSFFSRELLYSPTFISGLGIFFGNYLLHLRQGSRMYLLNRG